MGEFGSDVDSAGKKNEIKRHPEWTSQEEQGIFVGLEKASLGISDVTTLFGQRKKGPKQSLCDVRLSTGTQTASRLSVSERRGQRGVPECVRTLKGAEARR